MDWELTPGYELRKKMEHVSGKALREANSLR